MDDLTRERYGPLPQREEPHASTHDELLDRRRILGDALDPWTLFGRRGGPRRSTGAHLEIVDEVAS